MGKKTLKLKLSDAHNLTDAGWRDRFEKAGFPVVEADKLNDSIPIQHIFLRPHKSGLDIACMGDLMMSTNYADHTISFSLPDGKTKGD